MAQPEKNTIDLINEYMKTHQKIGNLAFDIFEDSPIYGRIPIKDALVTISKLVGNDYYISKVIRTDANGKTELVPLPTVEKTLSFSPEGGKAFSTYNACIEAPNYKPKTFYDIRLFDSVNTTQPVALEPVDKG